MRGRRVVSGIAVLAVVLAGTLAPASAAPRKKTGKFTALTYNVAGLPEPISGSEPSTNSPLISPKLNDYDLVLLQEDWADAVEALPLFTYHHLIVSEADHPYQSEPARPPMGTDLRRFPSGPPLVADGLNRLSDFPFGTLDRQMWEQCNGELTLEVAEAIVDGLGLSDVVDDAGLGEVIDGGSSDCAAQKGFSVARTKLARGVEVDVYNLHADAGGGAADAAARAANFAQLARFMERFSDGRAVILGGDTNLRSETREPDIKVWDDFRAATGLSDVCTVVDCGADSGEIDKFAFRSGGGVKLKPLTHKFEREKFTRDDGEPLSDHDPLAVTFRWTKRSR